MNLFINLFNMEEEEYDPYLVAFDNIKTEDNLLYQNNMVQEDENIINENENKLNEDIEMKDENNSEGNQQNLINESENNNINLNQNIPNNEINNNNNELNENKINESNNIINIQKQNKIKNNENKLSKEYEYGYSILYITEDENGLMEDFINDKSNESTTRDCFNFHLDENKWVKILNHSILVHYEKNMKEYIEKQKKMKQIQTMYINNQNINNVNGNHIYFTPIYLNQYKNMNIGNLKNMQLNTNK